MCGALIRKLVLPLGLLALLGACQSSSYQHGYAQSYGYSPAYDPCQASSDGCGRQARASFLGGQLCPPGYRLVRMSYRLHGGSARDCVPKAPYREYRYAGGPPHGLSAQSASPCCGRSYRYVQRGY